MTKRARERCRGRRRRRRRDRPSLGDRSSAWPSCTVAPGAAREVDSAASRSRGARRPRTARGRGGGERDGRVRTGPHDDVVDLVPRRDSTGSSPSCSSRAQRAGGQPVAAELVAGERGLVDDDDVAPGSGQRARLPRCPPVRRPPRRRRRPHGATLPRLRPAGLHGTAVGLVSPAAVSSAWWAAWWRRCGVVGGTVVCGRSGRRRGSGGGRRCRGRHGGVAAARQPSGR